MAIALPPMRRRGQAELGTLPPAACRSPGWTWQRGSEGSGRTDRRKEQRRRQQPGARSLGPMIVAGTFPVWLFRCAGPLLGGGVAALAFRLAGMASTPKVTDASTSKRRMPA